MQWNWQHRSRLLFDAVNTKWFQKSNQIPRCSTEIGQRSLKLFQHALEICSNASLCFLWAAKHESFPVLPLVGVHVQTPEILPLLFYCHEWWKHVHVIKKQLEVVFSPGVNQRERSALWKGLAIKQNQCVHSGLGSPCTVMDPSGILHWVLFCMKAVSLLDRYSYLILHLCHWRGLIFFSSYWFSVNMPWYHDADDCAIGVSTPFGES